MDANRTPERNLLPLEYQATYQIFENFLKDMPHMAHQQALNTFRQLLITQTLVRDYRKIIGDLEQQTEILNLRNRQMIAELCERNGQLADLSAELGGQDGTHF